MELSRFWMIVGADLIDGASLIGVDQCVGRTDGYGFDSPKAA